jgi:glutamate-1-semialdehyde aminotransferase
MVSMYKQYEKASKVLPGGVNSSVRYSQAHGVSIYMSRAKKGSCLKSADFIFTLHF